MQRTLAQWRLCLWLGLTTLGQLAACGLVPPPPPKEKPMSLNVTSSASRVGRPALPHIPFEGKRYEQIMNGEREGLGQRTGLMAVRDMATGKVVSVVKVYDFPRDPRMEADAGDVFFTRFQLDAGLRQIAIENERGQKFVYRIDDGSVAPAP